VNFIGCLQLNFMDIVYNNLKKISQEAIQGQTHPSELKEALMVQADILDSTIGKLVSSN